MSSTSVGWELALSQWTVPTVNAQLWAQAWCGVGTLVAFTSLVMRGGGNLSCTPAPISSALWTVASIPDVLGKTSTCVYPSQSTVHFCEG